MDTGHKDVGYFRQMHRAGMGILAYFWPSSFSIALLREENEQGREEAFFRSRALQRVESGFK